ncbi:unnamed protein product [Toxocara canis]|uniref:Uncharacterized protein n=1 Tax=Toxocara canis TaxID=6265 RepID=A0A183U616_TOXCA|nr:unnamed protein product [Toxocara canis]
MVLIRASGNVGCGGSVRGVVESRGGAFFSGRSSEARMGVPDEVADTVVEKVDVGDIENVSALLIIELIYRIRIPLSR